MATDAPRSRGVSAPDAATPPGGTPTDGSTATVAALLIAGGLDDDLIEVLLAIADQTRAPERLRIIDATLSGDLANALSHNTGLREQLPITEIDRVPAGTDVRIAFAAAVGDLDAAAVWVLTGATRPDPDALRVLCDELFATPGPDAADPEAALVGPKLLDADRPGRVQRFGIQATRSGRLRPSPVPGQPDQQQFDDRRNALAVPIEGALIRREAFEELGGFDPAFDGLAADLDLGWRAHRAGWRVGLAPAARVHLRGRPAHPAPVRDRRAARRVALTRCPLLAAPVLALWLLVSQAASALVLLLLKRPRAAGREFGDLAAVTDPWRLAAARARARRTPRRGRRTGAVFVPGAAVLTGGLDRLPDLIVPAWRPPPDPGAGDQAAGADPATRSVLADPEEHEQAVRNPGPWAVLVATVAALVAGRTLPGGLTGGLENGFIGATLGSVNATATDLWHSWTDAWSGPGLGTDEPGASGLLPFAAGTWVWQHLPFHDAGSNPAGALVGMVVLLAAPAAAVGAYRAGRVLTQRRWPRALAALIWALSPVAATTIGQGRLAAIALLVLLPAMLAGFAALTTSSRSGVAAAAALPTALLAGFVPAILVLALILAVGVGALGDGRTKLRAAAYLICTAVASAPLVWELRAEPLRFLGGWGLLAPADAAVTPLQIALLSPGQPTTPWSYAAVPVLVVGLLAVVRRTPPNGPAWFGTTLIVLGVGAAVVAPHVHISRGAGESIVAPWSGTGMLLLLAGLLTAGLHASDRFAGQSSRVAGQSSRVPYQGSRVAAGAAAGAATVAAACVLVGFVAGGLGDQLRPARDPRPAVAIDQAIGPASGRSVLVDISRGSVTYAVVGREPAAPAAELGATPPVEPAIESAIGALTAASGAAAVSPAQELARWGIGLVVVRPPVPAEVEHRLDATEFLSRIGDYAESMVWRIEPAAAGPGLTAPARVRLTSGSGDQLVPVGGLHGATRTRLHAPSAARLIVAEPAGWAAHARVLLDGVPLEATLTDGRPSYPIPVGDHDLDIAVASRFPLPAWTYLVTLALLVYIAIPLGTRGRSQVRGAA